MRPTSARPQDAAETAALPADLADIRRAAGAPAVAAARLRAALCDAARAAARPARRPAGAAALLAGALALPLAAAPGAATAQTAGVDGEAAVSAISIPQEELERPVALVADEVRFDNQSRILTAEGSVEVYQGDRTLTADRIEYDAATGRISAAGDVTLRTPEGATLIADMADLDRGMRDALIESARMQLPGGARFAAVQAQRIDGRYHVLGRAVFSSCHVCEADPTPLWRVRARRIVHDEVEKTIHYEDAQFDVLGVTVAWLPYFRHPDPTVERASGLLVPEYRASDAFGHAILLPYLWVIDERSDITLTPLLTTQDGAVLGAEYRRGFEDGYLSLGGSVGYNDYDGDERLRFHLDGAGLWALDGGEADPFYDGPLGYGWETGFELELASDDAYLRRFEFSDVDRLTSEAFVRQGDEDGWLEFSAVRFQSLRDDEAAGNIPTALPAFEGRRLLDDGVFGGALHLDASGYALKRTNGQDAAHFGLGMDWERVWTLDAGVQLRSVAELQGDLWRAADRNPGIDGSAARLHPQAAIEARWPLFRNDATGALAGLLGGGASHTLTPIAQAILAPYQSSSGIPNEDSQFAEFDETNIFSLRRHAGWDGVEEGPRVNLGLRYSLLGNDGTSFAATIGQTFRSRDILSFENGDGLNDEVTDLVGAWSLAVPTVGRVTHRFRLTDAGEIVRNEVYGTVAWGRTSLTGSYVMLAPESSGAPDRHEVAGELWRRITPNWAVGTLLRRDVEAADWVRTAGMLRYSNECVDLEFTAGRRFTRSEDVPPSTYVGLRLRLLAGSTEGIAASATGVCAPRYGADTADLRDDPSGR